MIAICGKFNGNRTTQYRDTESQNRCEQTDNELTMASWTTGIHNASNCWQRHYDSELYDDDDDDDDNKNIINCVLLAWHGANLD